MQPTNAPAHRASPDFARFNEVRARLGPLVAPVEIPIAGLGRSASATCAPKGGESFEIVYNGVSERGTDLVRTLAVALDKTGTGHGTVAGQAADGRRWRFQESLEGFLFHDPEDPDFDVGPSEDMRIRDSLRTAAIAYVDAHPHALAAFEVIRHVRRVAVHDALVVGAEAALVAARASAARTRADAGELEGALAAEMDGASAPTP